MGLNSVKYWPHWSAILKEQESGQNVWSIAGRSTRARTPP